MPLQKHITVQAKIDLNHLHESDHGLRHMRTTQVFITSFHGGMDTSIPQVDASATDRHQMVMLQLDN